MEGVQNDLNLSWHFMKFQTGQVQLLLVHNPAPTPHRFNGDESRPRERAFRCDGPQSMPSFPDQSFGDFWIRSNGYT